MKTIEIDTRGCANCAKQAGSSRREFIATSAAFSLICPHFGCTVGINGSSFLCPCHGAQFASSGTWMGGQRTSNLRSLSATFSTTTGVLTIVS